MLHIADVIAGVPELARLLDNETWITPVSPVVVDCEGKNHTFHIIKIDCLCIWDKEKDVHDVIECLSCGYIVHETPYYTEGA